VELVAELGGDHPLVALLVDGAADERLGQVVAVAFGGVEQVGAKLPSPPQQLVDLLLGEAPPPLAAKLPGANADDRDPQSRPA
jgi:hypothetical protein